MHYVHQSYVGPQMSAVPQYNVQHQQGHVVYDPQQQQLQQQQQQSQPAPQPVEAQLISFD